MQVFHYTKEHMFESSFQTIEKMSAKADKGCKE